MWSLDAKVKDTDPICANFDSSLFRMQYKHFSPVFISHLTTTTTNVLRPFVWDYLGESVPEETFTHPPSWPSSNLHQPLPSTTIHSILPAQITCLAIFYTTSLHVLFGLPLGLVWSPPPHIPYISSPSQCLLFATHAHTIATCFAVVSILYHLFVVDLYWHQHPHLYDLYWLQDLSNLYK